MFAMSEKCDMTEAEMRRILEKNPLFAPYAIALARFAFEFEEAGDPELNQDKVVRMLADMEKVMLGLSEAKDDRG